MHGLQGVKTLIVTTEYPPQAGGVGVSSQRIARILAGAGLEVTVAHCRAADGPVLLDENISASRDGDVEVLELLFSRHEPLGVPFYDRQHQVMRRGQELFQSLMSLQRRRGFQVINGLFLANTGLEVCAAARMTGARAMVSIRGNDIGKQFFLPGSHGALRYILDSAHMVTSVSEDLLRLAGTMSDLKGKSLVIPNSIDPRLAPGGPHRRLLDPAGPVVLGSQGIFHFKKGMPYLFKAAAALREGGHNLRLLLIGGYKDTREEEAHRRFISRFGIEELLEITGRCSREEAMALLPRLDLAIFPSLFAEGCPSAVLEAMTYSLPVVASDVGGIGALINDGETGLLVPPGDAGALEGAITRLLQSPEEGAAMGAAARHAALKHGEEQEREAWCEAYRQALEN